MVQDGGTMRTNSFCPGPWTRKQTPILLHLIPRRMPMAVALAAFERVLITAPDRFARKFVHQLL